MGAGRGYQRLARYDPGAARAECRMEALDLPPALADRLRTARRAVALTGAGISRESGLSTFRGAGGLWQRFRPEELATPEAFDRHPERVWSWYASRFQALRGGAAQPRAPRAVEIRRRLSVLHPGDAERRRPPPRGRQRRGPRAARLVAPGALRALRGIDADERSDRTIPRPAAALPLRRPLPAGGGLVRRGAAGGGPRAGPGPPPPPANSSSPPAPRRPSSRPPG